VLGSKHERKTVLAGVLLLGVGGFWLNSLGLSGAALSRVVAEALVFSGTSVISIFAAGKILGGFK